ncbi:MAG: hypothetical protein ACK55I_43560, partial [bacterium]
ATREQRRVGEDRLVAVAGSPPVDVDPQPALPQLAKVDLEGRLVTAAADVPHRGGLGRRHVDRVEERGPRDPRSGARRNESRLGQLGGAHPSTGGAHNRRAHPHRRSPLP